MSDRALLRTAIDTALCVYVYHATHSGVHDGDHRRCLLERHLHGRWDAHSGDADELTGFGIAYLARLAGEEC